MTAENKKDLNSGEIKTVLRIRKKLENLLKTQGERLVYERSLPLNNGKGHTEIKSIYPLIIFRRPNGKADGKSILKATDIESCMGNFVGGKPIFEEVFPPLKEAAAHLKTASSIPKLPIKFLIGEWIDQKKQDEMEKWVEINPQGVVKGLYILRNGEQDPWLSPTGSLSIVLSEKEKRTLLREINTSYRQLKKMPGL
ncbi:MAG: hypothetical protein Q8P80_01525 [Candidatus Levybacteria bacterium]|nr:hypothetical protein [Candidatus Levybacteria bacterium]